MPARSRAGGGGTDALDVALGTHAPAKPAAPAPTFFQALKPNSPLFPQTSRINVARPAAQARVAARVVPPPQKPPPARTAAQAKAELAAHMPHASGVGDLASGVAHYVEHNPVRLAATAIPGPLGFLANPLVAKAARVADEVGQKGVAAAAHVTQAGEQGGTPGAASTAAGILSSYQKMGTEYAALAPDAQAKVRSALSFFAANPTYKYAGVKNLGLYTPAQKAAKGLPPTATDFDVYRKIYEPYTGHRNFLEETLHNLPLSLIQNVAAPLGAYDVLTHPTTMGPEFAREQYQFGKSLIPGVGDPLGAFEQNPVGVATAVLGVARGAGGAGGTFARSRFNPSEGLKMFATPSERNVVPAGYGEAAVGPDGKSLVPPVNRGKTSPKLDVALAQRAKDELAARVPFFGNRLDKERVGETAKEQNRFEHQLKRNEIEPAVRTAVKLNKGERRAMVSFRGQGYHSMDEAAKHTSLIANRFRATEPSVVDDPEAHAAWVRKQANLDQKAELAAKLAKSPRVRESGRNFQQALEANQAASRAGEEHMLAQGVGSRETFERRDYIPRARIDADLYGSESAKRMLDLVDEHNQIQTKLKTATFATRDRLQARLERVRNDLHAAQQTRLASVTKRIEALEQVQGHQAAAVESTRRTPATDAVEKVINRQGNLPRPEAARLEAMQGHAAEAFPQGDRIQPHEVVAADKHLRLLERKLRAAQGSATRARLQAKIDEFTPIRDKMAAAPVGPEVRHLRAQAARAGVESRVFAAHEQAAAPMLPKALRADERQHGLVTRRLTKPVDRKLARLHAERARLESTLNLPSDIHTATTRNLETRLGNVETPDTLHSRLEQVHHESLGAVAGVRAAHREAIGAPPVEANAPLDQHDPLWFQHMLEGERGVRGIRRGSSNRGTNLDAGPGYGARRGVKGQQASGRLFAEEASTDPSLHFKNLGKPQKVTARLRNLKAHMADAIHNPPPGSEYDPEKFVFVKASAGPQTPLVPHTTADTAQAVHDLSANALRKHILDHFQEPEMVQGSRMASVPNEPGYLMTKNARAEVEATVRAQGGKLMQFFQNSTDFWRWMTLTARPAWLVNNIGGTAIQTAMEGVGPGSVIKALRTGPGGKYEGTIPPQVNNAGFMGGSFERPEGIRQGAGGIVDRISRGIVNVNVKQENLMRRAVAVQESLNQAKAQLHGEERTVANNLHRTTQEIIELARHRTPETDAAILHRVHAALGDFLGKGSRNPALGVLSPFYRWFQFITKLTVEMPVRTPGRALVMQRLGAFGMNVQNQETGGATPNSWLGQIRVPDWVPHYGGEYKSTQALFPYSTLFQLLAPTDQSTTDPGQISYTGALGAANPAITAALEFATGKNPTFDFADLKDASGSKVGYLNPRVGLHAAMTAFPVTNLFGGYGQTDTNINPFAPEQRDKGALSQPGQDFWDRLAGYGFGSVSHRDITKNWIAAHKRFTRDERALVHQRASHGHGPKAK